MPVPAFDHAEATRLVAELRAEADRAARQDFGGLPPAAFARVAGDLLELAGQYAREHEQEAARGWDALHLLRGLRPVLARAVANAKASAEVAKEAAAGAGTGGGEREGERERGLAGRAGGPPQRGPAAPRAIPDRKRPAAGLQAAG